MRVLVREDKSAMDRGNLEHLGRNQVVLTDGGLTFGKGIFPKMNGNITFVCLGEVFMKLVEELRPFISPDPRSPNRTAVSAERKLALTLYFLKDTGSIRMAANAFGIAKSTVSIIVHDFCQAIT